jgi:hypothetical protein
MRKVVYVLGGVLATMMIGVVIASVGMPLATAIPACCFAAIGLGVSIFGSIAVYREGKRNERN